MRMPLTRHAHWQDVHCRQFAAADRLPALHSQLEGSGGIDYYLLELMVMHMNSDFLRGKDNVDDDHKRGNMCVTFLRLQAIRNSVKWLAILVLS